jgi:hypothetical protein
MADQHHAPSIDAREPADDRRIVGERPIPGQRQEIVRDPGDIILEVRPIRMARDLRLLPRGQLGVSVAQQLVGLGLQAGDLGVDVDVDVRVACRLAQLGDFRLQLGDRLFEIQVIQQSAARVGRSCRKGQRAPVASGWRALTSSISRALSTCV